MVSSCVFELADVGSAGACDAACDAPGLLGHSRVVPLVTRAGGVGGRPKTAPADWAEVDFGGSKVGGCAPAKVGIITLTFGETPTESVLLLALTWFL